MFDPLPKQALREILPLARKILDRETAMEMLRLMTRKFGALTTGQRRRIEQADGETLLRWSEQLLFAQLPEEALR